MRKYMLTLLIVPLFLIAACSDSRSDADANFEQNLEAFRADVQRDLDDIEQGLDELEALVEEASEDAQDELYKTLTELRAQRDKLSQDLDQVEIADEASFPPQERALTERLRNLATELEATRLNAPASREMFQHTVEARLDEIDEDLAGLEQQAQSLENPDLIPEEMFRDLYWQRDEVGLQVEQLTEAPAEMFQEMRDDVAWAVARLDVQVSETADRLEQTLELGEETTAGRVLR
jgi:hypothetical protein